MIDGQSETTFVFFTFLAPSQSCTVWTVSFIIDSSVISSIRGYFLFDWTFLSYSQNTVWRFPLPVFDSQDLSVFDTEEACVIGFRI